MPCKKDKCILLPVCKSKQTIRCKDLSDYYWYCVWIGRNMWVDICRTLPNLNKISNGLIDYYKGDK